MGKDDISFLRNLMDTPARTPGNARPRHIYRLSDGQGYLVQCPHCLGWNTHGPAHGHRVCHTMSCSKGGYLVEGAADTPTTSHGVHLRAQRVPSRRGRARGGAFAACPGPAHLKKCCQIRYAR